DLDERLPRPGRARAVLEELERERARRIELVGALGVRRRGPTIAELLADDVDELRVELQALRGLRRLVEQQLVERRQPRPLLVLLVEGQQGARRARVAGIRGQDALVRAEGALGLAEALLEHAGG